MTWVRRRSTATASVLDDELALAVESVSKEPSVIHESLYTPAISVFASFRERRGGAGGGSGAPPFDEDDEDDDDEAEALSVPEEGTALLDVSFEVRRGEAVGVVGSSNSAGRTLAQVLSGMAAPSSGRILVRGRIGLTIELALALSRRETTARSVAKLLAGLAGTGPRGRGAYIRDTLRLALGDESPDARAARPSRDVLKRVAAAAAFDSTADVLIVDGMPSFGDPGFQLRCRERLTERLAAGAGAVITNGDLSLIRDFCTRVVCIEEGRVARIVTPDEAIEDHFGTAPADAGVVEAFASAGTRRRKPPLNAFDEHLALFSVTLLREDGAPLDGVTTDEPVVVRIGFESTVVATIRISVSLVGRTTLPFFEKVAVRRGAYAATLRVPPGSIPADVYDVAVALVLERGEERTKVGRRRAAQLRVDGDEEGLALTAETGSFPPTRRSLENEAEWSLEAEDD